MLQRILETNLPQGVEPLRLLQRALVGTWGDSEGSIFLGQVILKLQTTGVITNISQNPSIVILALGDGASEVHKLEPDEVLDKEYQISLIISTL